MVWVLLIHSGVLHKSSQVTFIYIAPLTIQIVTKHCINKCTEGFLCMCVGRCLVGVLALFNVSSLTRSSAQP